jgi:hypothetical protein
MIPTTTCVPKVYVRKKRVYTDYDELTKTYVDDRDILWDLEAA